MTVRREEVRSFFDGLAGSWDASVLEQGGGIGLRGVGDAGGHAAAGHRFCR